MAQSAMTEGGLLVIPGGYASYKVERTVSGLAQTGVVFLVGESDAGPRFSDEVDLAENSYGPDQIAEIMAKYKAGPLVDACREIIAAANDPEIIGSVNRVVPVKINASTRATGTLTKQAGGTYETVAARAPGRDGNLISYQVKAKVAESLPTTGSFTLLAPQAATDTDFRANGGAALPLTLAAQALPATNVAAINGLAGVAATGGANRGVLGGVSGNLSLAIVSGNSVTVTYTGTWALTPSVGDLMYIPTGSAIAGAGSANCGSYVVTAATTATITATKLLDATGAGSVLTSPVGVGSTAVAATTDVQAHAPVTITLEAGVVVDGLGKSLELNELTSAAGRLSDLCYALSTTKCTFVSKAATPVVVGSTSEYQANLVVSRQSDSVTEELIDGGKVLLTLGYKGTTGSAVIANGTMTITVAGGAGTSPAAIKLSEFKTINDLTSYLSTLTGFSAAPGTTALGQNVPTTLDEGTFNIGSTHGAKTGRIKQDAYRFGKLMLTSVLAKLGSTATEAAAKSGLPATMATAAFLAGGAKGATSDADFAAAMLALESVRGNFLVPLFSNDAAEDIADGLTESTSTYTIESINAAAKAHVLAMSTLKRRRNRQAFLSHRGTFDASKNAAGNIAHPRCLMTFQDVRTPNSVGTVVQQRPWMAAVKTAGAQAAAFYRSVVRKGINVSGAVHANASFNHNSDSQVEDALLSGLCPLRKDDAGQWIWVSDQTTYATDENFVWNSCQAVYASDIVTMTAAQKTEKALVGQSQADISAGMAKMIVESVLDELKALKLLASSADAPKGYKSLTVKINGKRIDVGAEVKLAGTIYFSVVQFVVSAVQSSA